MNELGNTPADKNYKPSGMSRAEERAFEVYQKLSVASVCLDGTSPVDLNTGARKRFIEGYEQATQDIIALVQSRLSEIVGDAQPKPILRAELEELITKIKDEN